METISNQEQKLKKLSKIPQSCDDDITGAFSVYYNRKKKNWPLKTTASIKKIKRSIFFNVFAIFQSFSTKNQIQCNHKIIP
jgi:hypothetical protein